MSHASLPDELRLRIGLRGYDAVIYTATTPQAEAARQPEPRSALSLYNTKPLPPVRGGRGGEMGQGWALLPPARSALQITADVL